MSGRKQQRVANRSNNTGEVCVMSSTVRIIKRGKESLNDFKSNQNEKTDQSSTREIVSTVKGWIAELEQRHRAEERKHSALKK